MAGSGQSNGEPDDGDRIPRLNNLAESFGMEITDFSEGLQWN